MGCVLTGLEEVGMRKRRGPLFPLAIIAKVQIERQYVESMFFVRILVQGMAEKIVLEKISGKTFLLEAIGFWEN